MTEWYIAHHDVTPPVQCHAARLRGAFRRGLRERDRARMNWSCVSFARAGDIIVNDWEGVVANRQVELLGPIERGIVKRERVHELRDIVASRVSVRQLPGSILYYKNNTGLAIQFAACGAILYRKLIAEGTNRTIPREWFASQKYSIPAAPG